MLVLNKLKENGKIARATHNMYAWRIEESIDGRIIKRHDCEVYFFWKYLKLFLKADFFCRLYILHLFLWKL